VIERRKGEEVNAHLHTSDSHTAQYNPFPFFPLMLKVTYMKMSAASVLNVDTQRSPQG